jgi:hypothetical protein
MFNENGLKSLRGKDLRISVRKIRQGGKNAVKWTICREKTVCDSPLGQVDNERLTRKLMKTSVSQGEVSMLTVPMAGWGDEHRCRTGQFHRKTSFWPRKMVCKSKRSEDTQENGK